jgi:HSP20 family protein
MEVRYENGLLGNGWLFDRMNGIFRELEPQTRRVAPPTDVVEDKDAYHFYFEMAGLKNESIDVRVEDGQLVVEAERKRPEWPKDAEVHLAERAYGTIRRAFEMPKDASQDHIRASYKDGVLEVTVEKRPESKPVKIQIN